MMTLASFSARPMVRGGLFTLLLAAKLAMIWLLVALISPAHAAAPHKARAVAKVRSPQIIDTAPRVAVILQTSLGPITVELDREHAPITAANFLRYVDQKRLDGTVFYRSMKLGSEEDGMDQGLIQGGTQNDPKRILKPIAHEPTNITGLKHLAGAISMARFAPGTATGDFSILVSPLPGLDADPSRAPAEEPLGYAVFGYVTDGMDIVRKIHAGATSPTKGTGWLKGQMLEPVVKILTVRRAPVQPAAR
ncbi:MAG: peptidylprolyl isomerase [Chakrabartia sp.]